MTTYIVISVPMQSKDVLQPGCSSGALIEGNEWKFHTIHTNSLLQLMVDLLQIEPSRCSVQTNNVVRKVTMELRGQCECSKVCTSHTGTAKVEFQRLGLCSFIISGKLQPKLPSYVTSTSQIFHLSSLLLQPNHAAQTQKREQMGETAQEVTQNDVSRLRELAVVKAIQYIPTLCTASDG